MSSIKKPNLFIVGHPRSGTTSLYNYLRKHPEIYMSPVKEPHYFCKDFHSECDNFFNNSVFVKFPYRTEKEYLSLFRNAKNEIVIGEASATYLYSKVTTKEIYEFNPDAKIIMIFREPVDFLHSLHALFCRNLSENICDFKEALKAEKTRRTGKNIPRYIKTPSFLYYSEWIKYSNQIKRYYKYFPEEQVKVIIFDDMKRDTYKVYRDILDFLAVNPNFRPEFKKYNTNSAVYSKKLGKIIKEISYSPMRKFVPKPLRKIVWNYIISPINKLNLRKVRHPPLDPDYKRELMKQFKQEVIKFSNIIGRDLTLKWGYTDI